MKDFLKNYRKRKIIWNVYIMLWALIMAFSLNFMIFDGINFEQNLKASIFDSKKIEKKADFYLEKEREKLFLKSSKSMQFVESISFSLVYDAENLQIDEIKSDFWKVESFWEKFSWIETFILNFSEKNISPNELIAEIKFSKKYENKKTNINLLNSNFSDWKSIYTLTTSWINL